MQTVLFIISSLEYSGAARQMCLLAKELPRESFRVHVVVLGTETPWVESLRQEGVEVAVMNWRRPFDILPFVKLRRFLHTLRPDLIHVWGTSALRALALSGVHPMSRLFVSAVVSFNHKTNALDRWLIRRAGEVVAFGTAEAMRYRRLGVNEQKITVVSPGVIVPAENGTLVDLPGIADTQRVLLGVGPIERHKGFREAVWAFDILAHFYDDVQLVLAGSGSDRPRVERFARQIGVSNRVHLLGPYSEISSLLQRADVVWVPSLRGGGVCVTLEAMAAGRPVIASRLTDLADIVTDGETGFLIEPNHKAALARQSRLLLDDAELSRRMGEAGRRRARECFSVARLVETCARRYAGFLSKQ
jgi:glycosyltransferase involved in cell wall biosynthesis